MASKIKKGTLTVRLSEDIVLNGQQQGGTNILTIPSINETSKRILTITTSKHDVMSFSSIVGKGNYSLADMRYIRFTNLDDTNHLFLIFKNEDNDEFIVLLDKGQ